ncbi:MAG: hypothetical protein AAGE01_22525 [Pseudomonadota bacterium]
MSIFAPLVPFVLGWLLLLLTTGLSTLALVNAAAQTLLFVVVVNVPAWRTGRLSYVDIGWPLGVALIGALTLVLADGQPARKAAVSLAYLLIGLRMGLGALQLWRRGHLREELPRYRYQRRRWERKGLRNERLPARARPAFRVAHHVHDARVPATPGLPGVSADHQHVLSRPAQATGCCPGRGILKFARGQEAGYWRSMHPG